MDYKVLYRKYRPTDFDSLVGQNHIVKTLKNAIIYNKHAHAYIFSGPRGTGKTSAAKIFAKAINCEKPIDGNPCNKCNTCLSFDTSPDIIEIDAASNNGVDEIRELINNVKLTPSFSKYKVYIIDEVHMLSQSAFNALLLTLEEPPSHVIFIFATTDIQNVPITVLSRCQRYDFKYISTEDIINRLKYVAKKEKISIEKDAIAEIALYSEGGLRDALSVLDQLVETEDKKILLEDVINTFGTISIQKINDLLSSIEKNEVSNVIDIMNQLFLSGINYKIFVEKLILNLKTKAIDIKLGKTKSRMNYQQVKQLIFDLNNCLTNIKLSVNPYTLIELVLLDYVDTDLISAPAIEEITHDEIPIEIEKIKKLIVESENCSEELIKVRVNNCLAEAKKDCLKKLKINWKDYLLKLKKIDRKLLSILADSEIVTASDNHAIIASENLSNVELINDSLDDIFNTFKEICNININFIALDIEQWEKEKNKYVENIKNNIKYEIIDEKKVIKRNQTKIEIEAKDLFGEILEVN